jgi:8-amino-7-oxononanoate synthase
MKSFLKMELDKIKAKGLYRQMKILASAPDKEIIFEGKSYINFSSNNYLGFSCRPELKQAAINAVKKYGCGGTSSRLICGTFHIHAELEEKLAKLKSKEKAIVFPSGFAANIGVVSSIVGKGDAVIMDKLNHASLWDGASLSGARLFVYEHKDMQSLEKVLKRAHSYKKRLIITDTLFSMDGDIAPLKDITDLAKKYCSWTMIDEAHATGIFGKNGSGIAESFNVEKDIDIVMGTLSKAIGSQGGFICGDNELIDYLINKSRAFIYTTALSPACAGASIKALEVIEKEPKLRIKLLENSKYLRDKLKLSGFDTLGSESQIIPVLTGDAARTMDVSAQLMSRGIFAPAIRPPTVAEGMCRIRISLTSLHRREEIDKLIEAFQNLKS